MLCDAPRENDELARKERKLSLCNETEVIQPNGKNVRKSTSQELISYTSSFDDVGGWMKGSFHILRRSPFKYAIMRRGKSVNGTK